MATPEPDTAALIIGLERAALERWGQGDPDGFLDISADHVSYFDPFVVERLDSLAALRAFYDQFRGKMRIDGFEMIAPRVQVAGNVAVLTFRFESHGGEDSMQWNTTEVYQKTQAGWKIIHTHWAIHQP